MKKLLTLITILNIIVVINSANAAHVTTKKGPHNIFSFVGDYQGNKGCYVKMRLWSYHNNKYLAVDLFDDRDDKYSVSTLIESKDKTSSTLYRIEFANTGNDGGFTSHYKKYTFKLTKEGLPKSITIRTYTKTFGIKSPLIGSKESACHNLVKI